MVDVSKKPQREKGRIMWKTLEINKTYNLEDLEFEQVPGNPESYWAATLEEDGDGDSLQTIYDFKYCDGKAEASLAIGNPQSGVWFDSESTADWPMLDKAFGREHWQKFLEDLSEEATAELRDNEA